jgi:hypothetical protein
VTSTPDWSDYNFIILEIGKNDDIPNKKVKTKKKKKSKNKNEPANEKTFNSDWQILGSDKISYEIEKTHALVIFDKKEEELTAWTQNNAWTEQDFRVCTWGDQPTFDWNGRGPECESLFAITNLENQQHSIENNLKSKRIELKERQQKGEQGLWMFLDSGASRSVIREDSPLRPHLYNLKESNGSCSVGNGAALQYLQKGLITNGNEVTVVKDLQYDLYAAVAAAKRGISCILDFNKGGENQSYLLDKKSGTVTPLIERKSGILEIPVHLYIDGNGNDKGLTVTEKDKLSMSTISKFWQGMDKHEFDPTCRANNTDELYLFMFDIIKSLNPKQRDYLIHARLAHLPRKAILQMVKNGATGHPYEGKFKELCRPCLEAKHRAENHGHETSRHPDGKPGEYLHLDLAVVNLPDFSGYKYVNLPGTGILL